MSKYYLETYSASFKLKSGRNAQVKIFKERRKKDDGTPYSIRVTVSSDASHVPKAVLSIEEIQTGIKALNDRYLGKVKVQEHIFYPDSKLELVDVIDNRDLHLLPADSKLRKMIERHPTAKTSYSVRRFIFKLEGCLFLFAGKPYETNSEWNGHFTGIMFPNSSMINVVFYRSDDRTFRDYIRSKVKEEFHNFKDEIDSKIRWATTIDNVNKIG